ncbi:MAG: glycosyltransferase family 4 protein [Planctomycetota bacterium]
MKVLYIYPFGPFYPVSSGSDIIASNHMEYFRQKGWDVDCCIYQITDKEKHLPAFREKYKFCRSIHQISLPGIYFKFGELLFASEYATRIEPLKSLLLNNYDYIFTNYVFTAPLAAAAKKTATLILETHDHFFEANFLSQNLKSNIYFEKSLLQNIEFDLYKIFNKIIFINKDEYDSTPKESGISYSHIPAAWQGITNKTTRDQEIVDLLFIGSNHPPNIDGINYFYQKVFLPFLRPKGISLSIAGKVCDNINIEDPKVKKIGFYNGNIGDLYSSTKVIIIPILDGSGLSIKTMEAMAFGKPIVTTPKGARGMNIDANPFMIVDMKKDPESFAAAILNLLDSPEKRKTLGQIALDQFTKEHSFAVYSQRMDRFLGV